MQRARSCSIATFASSNSDDLTGDEDTSQTALLSEKSRNELNGLAPCATATRRSKLVLAGVGLLSLLLTLNIAQHVFASDGSGEGGFWSLSFPESPTSSKQRPCDPYDYNGVLHIGLDPQQVVFHPILSPPECKVEDLMLALRRRDSSTEYLRNKTVLAFGDSVDRNLQADMCHFSGGMRSPIPPEHPLAPPYPQGEEFPPSDYAYGRNSSEWPNNPDSRPWICHYEQLNFRLVNVFHFGFRPNTTYITHHQHYYPPGPIEKRFDEIIVPMMNNIAATYGVSNVPDVLTFSPGFWTIMRTKFESVNGTATEQNGTLHEPISAWNVDNLELSDWFVTRIQQTISHIARAWSDQPKRPMILWRPLPAVPGNNQVTMAHAHSLNEIGTAVVRSLIAEGEAAQSRRDWSRWSERAAVLDGWIARTRQEVLDMNLGERLRISRYADIILGTRRHLRDAIHPAALPSGQLYGNMLLQLLKNMALS